MCLFGKIPVYIIYSFPIKKLSLCIALETGGTSTIFSTSEETGNYYQFSTVVLVAPFPDPCSTSTATLSHTATTYLERLSQPLIRDLLREVCCGFRNFFMRNVHLRTIGDWILVAADLGIET